MSSKLKSKPPVEQPRLVLCETYCCGNPATQRMPSGLGRHGDGWLYKCDRCKAHWTGKRWEQFTQNKDDHSFSD